jgi:hypothetical protein
MVEELTRPVPNASEENNEGQKPQQQQEEVEIEQEQNSNDGNNGVVDCSSIALETAALRTLIRTTKLKVRKLPSGVGRLLLAAVLP